MKRAPDSTRYFIDPIWAAGDTMLSMRLVLPEAAAEADDGGVLGLAVVRRVPETFANVRL